MKTPSREDYQEARRYYEALRRGGLEETTQEWSDLGGAERFLWADRVATSLRDYPETTRQLLALVESEADDVASVQPSQEPSDG